MHNLSRRRVRSRKDRRSVDQASAPDSTARSFFQQAVGRAYGCKHRVRRRNRVLLVRSGLVPTAKSAPHHKSGTTCPESKSMRAKHVAGVYSTPTLLSLGDVAKTSDTMQNKKSRHAQSQSTSGLKQKRSPKRRPSERTRLNRSKLFPTSGRESVRVQTQSTQT